jgi:hypothetical protein
VICTRRRRRDNECETDPQRSQDFGTDVDEALEVARDMPPGQERIEALKAAGMLRNAADVFGVVFAKRGRPSK